MAVEILRPNGTASAGWPSLSGASHHAATSDDSDTTYIRNNTSTPQTDVLDLADTALTTENIDSVDIRFRARSESSATGQIQIGLRLGGSDSLAANEASIPTTAANYTRANISRPGGGSWSVSDLNSLQVLAIGDNGGGAAVRCFEIYVDVNYTSGGGFTPKVILF